jgi:epoxyqueuosine reductase
MAYLADSLDERLDPRAVLPTARSVVSVGVVYNTGNSGREADAQTSSSADGRAIVARYARGEDYHDVIRSRLRALLTWMAGEAGPGFEAFPAWTTGPCRSVCSPSRRGLDGLASTRA